MQAINDIRTEKINSRIIVLTIHEDREYLIKTLQWAQRVMCKDAEPSVLLDAIRSVHQGQSYIQPNMTKELVKEFNRLTSQDKEKYGENRLTTREREVLKLIAEGMINKEIATKLYISEKTVKNHVSNIFRKLNVSDRTQAAIYALKHNI